MESFFEIYSYFFNFLLLLSSFYIEQAESTEKCISIIFNEDLYIFEVPVIFPFPPLPYPGPPVPPFVPPGPPGNPEPWVPNIDDLLLCLAFYILWYIYDKYVLEWDPDNDDSDKKEEDKKDKDKEKEEKKEEKEDKNKQNFNV